jgi:PKD repeat protein
MMKKGRILLLAVLLCFINTYGQEWTASPEDYIRSRTKDIHGDEITGIIVPGKPPDKHREPVATPTRSAVMLSNVPAFDWSFGCSATSAAMAAGYFDNNGYPGMYTGPTNGGVMPMNNSSWGYVVINGETRAQCPLSATRNTVDGRTSRGHVDDYWIQYNHPGPDPFIANGWEQHTYGDCTGDFMGTNQSALGNVDGGTTFYMFTNGSPLYNYTGCEPNQIDGCHGLRDFYESRGYAVIQNYSQYIYGYNGNTLGFTFNQYKQEIDAGRPVIIQVAGHSMLGVGYDDTGNTVYLHDTWDYNLHTMTWGGSYSGMAHYGVCVVELEPPSAFLIANFSASTTFPQINTTVIFTDLTIGIPASWSWSISPETYTYVGGTNSSSQNPQVQFNIEGPYTITLTVSNSETEDSETKPNYINAIDCSPLLLPFTGDFSEGGLPDCWLNLDNQGNGQVWQFDNPGGRTILTTTTANGFAILDSDHYGSGNSQNAELITPVFDFSAYTIVILGFEHYFMYYAGSSAILSYSINGGSSWTAIQTWTATTANPAIFSLDISSLVAGQSNVKFSWKYTGTYGWYWAVDDISITGTMPGLWKGATSSNWNTASNWDDGMVPAGTTNVVISPDATFWPDYPGDFTVGAQCANVNIPEGSEMTVNGNFTINAGCCLTFSGAGELKIGGDWTNNGTFDPGAGTINFFGTETSTVNPSPVTVANYNLADFTKGMTVLTGATLGPSGDQGGANIAIGFTFVYCGVSYSNIRFCTNGWLSFDLSGAVSYDNIQLFTTAVPNTTLAPWWDDLVDDGTSKLYYKTEGTAPNRVFTAEWNRVKSFSSTSTTRISFQVKLLESVNVIEFHYGNIETGIPSPIEGASIGIEDGTGGSGHFIEATTGSTTTGVTNLVSTTNWPTVNYRFTPSEPVQTFNNIIISKNSASVDFNSMINIEGTLNVMPGAAFKIISGMTMNIAE